MRLKPQYVFIIVVVGVVLVYFIGRTLFGGSPEKAEAKTTPPNAIQIGRAHV